VSDQPHGRGIHRDDLPDFTVSSVEHEMNEDQKLAAMFRVRFLDINQARDLADQMDPEKTDTEDWEPHPADPDVRYIPVMTGPHPGKMGLLGFIYALPDGNRLFRQSYILDLDCVEGRMLKVLLELTPFGLSPEP